MIVELAASGAAVAALAYALRQLRDRRAPPPPDKNVPPKPKGPRGLQLGDVLLYASDELWLGGCAELREEGELVARLFRAPGNERAEWVLQLDGEARDIAFLSATDALPPGAVPVELPLGGIRHHLERRGSATLTAEGEDVPTAPTAEFTWLGGTAGRLVFVLDPKGGERLALAGERIPRAMIELLQG